MKGTLPAELAAQLGLTEEGQEKTIYVNKVNEDGSVDVVCDYGEGAGPDDTGAPMDEGEPEAAPAAAPKAFALIVKKKPAPSAAPVTQ